MQYYWVEKGGTVIVGDHMAQRLLLITRLKMHDCIMHIQVSNILQVHQLCKSCLHVKFVEIENLFDVMMQYGVLKIIDR